MDVTITIPATVLYLVLFNLGMACGALLSRWVYRVRVPYRRPAVLPQHGGYQPVPDYPRPPTPAAPPRKP